MRDWLCLGIEQELNFEWSQLEFGPELTLLHVTSGKRGSTQIFTVFTTLTALSGSDPTKSAPTPSIRKVICFFVAFNFLVSSTLHYYKSDSCTSWHSVTRTNYDLQHDTVRITALLSEKICTLLPLIPASIGIIAATSAWNTVV